MHLPLDARSSPRAKLPRVSIAGLRSRQAVLDAMAEHDRLGPNAFLQEYGYGEPDRYWIVHAGRRYPSKAILGVGWHHEDPSRPPLHPSQFSGGRATVQRKAEELGFEVAVDRRDDEPARGAPLVSEQLTAGAVYTRAELGRLLDMNPNGMGQGVFRRRGTDSVLIFVTEDKPADRTQYVDRLEGDVLHWQGQESRRTDSLVIEHAARGLELLLFYRRRKDEFPGYGFRYLGAFAYASHVTPPGSGASSFILRRADAVAPLAALLGAQDSDDRPFDPTNLEDARREVMRTIKDRRGQRSLPQRADAG